VQKFVPPFMKGPSVSEQLTSTQQNLQAEQQKLGRPLTLRERLAAEPVTSSPVAMGFATHQVGGDIAGPMAAATKGAGEKFIQDQYRTSIKPTVAGKPSSPQVVEHLERARAGVSSIIKNKPNLQFSDAAGKVRAGELPKSLEEFGDAVAQTKQGIFKEYDDMAKATGAAGIDVDLTSGAQAAHALANDPVLNLIKPKLAKYAQERADAFSQKGRVSATEAQDAIQMMNQDLKSFYAKGTAKAAGRAIIDKAIVEQMRSSLDQAVESAVGPGYQGLKDKYGSLSAIEKEVNHRAGIVGRQEPGGGIFGRITDAISAQSVLHGLFTGNLAAVGAGAGTKLVGEYVKHIRSPNRAVSRIFAEAERQESPPAPPIVPSAPLSPIFPDRRRPAATLRDLGMTPAGAPIPQ
jgi:hypothetical protein